MRGVEFLGDVLLLLGILWLLFGARRMETKSARTATYAIAVVMLGFAAWRAFQITRASTPELRAVSALALVIAVELVPRRLRADRANDIFFRTVSILAACFAVYTLLFERR